ncbi:MAG: serine/threonine protein kinase [Lysobacterales bacterium]
MKKTFSIPILGWVAIGLAIVGALPFALSWYQIQSSREAMVDQTQLTHLLVARANADGIADYLNLLDGLLASAGDHPDVYLEPNSEASLEVLKETLGARPEIKSLGLFSHGAVMAATNDETQGASPALLTEEIFVLAKKGHEPVDGAYLEQVIATGPMTLARGETSYLLVSREIARPGVFVLALLDNSQIDERSAPPELGDAARLAVVNQNGVLVAGDGEALALIPDDILTQTREAPVRSDAHRFALDDGFGVAAFARIPEANWSVVSVQPARQAEQATASMRQTAWQAFAALAVVMGVLLFGAHRLVVKPVRQMIASQRRLLGSSNSGGSEITQLKDSFERLEMAMAERDSLSEVFLDRYQITRRVGSGAMGTVYLGWDPKLSRQVALKTVKLDAKLPAAEREELTAALLQEGITSAGLTHPNIVTVYDVLGNDEFAFIAMEFVDGEGLDERLKREVRMSPKAVAEAADSILRGLRAAHDRGVIHRDIKPANILVAKDGSMKVSDFGIAGLINRSGEGERVIMGTPGYLAPETYLTAEFGVATDLFAVGVVMVECLTGQTVFAGRNTAQIITRTSSKDVSLPAEIAAHVPQPLQELIGSLLEKKPAKRPISADAVLERLAPIITALAGTPDDAAELDYGSTLEPLNGEGNRQGDERGTVKAVAGGSVKETVKMDPGVTDTRRIDR